MRADGLFNSSDSTQHHFKITLKSPSENTALFPFLLSYFTQFMISITVL
ncbi:conserved hypothetical protein [Aggregatibacter segnis ATCC 33393]|uniref:Uncharacterized protein n=1 Tax=Aggregatibacter segnis ATCC 33393 TaxID=888057 RepID=E6KXT3_9PAST|nr:conserved hypothetical protein [Aggregatibacter segnis ATCC 33393]